MLRYSKLSDPQVLAKLLIVCDKENIPYGDDGMEAIVFTAQGILNLKLLRYLAIILQTIKLATKYNCIN